MIREIYRRGVRDACDWACVHLPPRKQRAMEEWLTSLDLWCDGNPPWKGRESRLLISAVIGFAVVFVNPYGVELVTFPIALLSRGDILSHIVEWKSPSFRDAWGIALAALTLSFMGLLGFGIAFFVTSVWFWQVAGFSFATVFTRRFELDRAS